MTPVYDPALCRKLDSILTGELDGSPEGKRRWILTADGRYDPDA